MNTINLYLLLQSSHSNSQLVIYYANARMVTLADIYMPNDPRVIITGEPFGHQPWAQNVFANLRYRKLQVDTLAPVHGDVEAAASRRRRYSSPRSRRRPTAEGSSKKARFPGEGAGQEGTNGLPDH